MVTNKKATKKSVKKSVPKVKVAVATKPEGKLIGKITHYFSNIEVAVIELSAPLKVGYTIRVTGGQETDFEQEVASMQIEHEQVKSAKKGDGIGIKVSQKVHEGYRVFKV